MLLEIVPFSLVHGHPVHFMLDRPIKHHHKILAMRWDPIKLQAKRDAAPTRAVEEVAFKNLGSF